MAAGWIAKSIRAKIESRDNMTCCYCGKVCTSYKDRSNETDYATLDHIVSRWEIAQTCESDAEFQHKIKDPTTLVVVCNGCNSSKKHTPLYIWCNKKGYNHTAIIAEIARRIAINL